MARLVDQIPHYQNLFEVLKTLNPPRSLLFVGPRGAGQVEMCQALAQFFLCENKTQKPCGVCPSCLRIEKLQHENFLFVQPEGTQIKVDQARQILTFLKLQTVQGFRFIVIQDAHLMNLQTSNILLKAFEEPPQGTFFILIAPSAHHVLATIRSRAQVLLFPPLALTDLQKIFPRAPAWLLKSARGRASEVTRMLEASWLDSRTLAAQELVRFLSDKNFLSSQEWRTRLKDKTVFSETLQFWLSFLRDALANDTSPALNSDQKDLLRVIRTHAVADLCELTEQVLKVLAEMQFHRDPLLCLEQLYVRYRSLSPEGVA